MDKEFTNENVYEVLGIAADAEVAEVEKAFRKLSLKYHPDKVNPATIPLHGETDTEKAVRERANNERYTIIVKCREILSDEVQRKAYDRELRHVKQNGTTSGNFDVWGGLKVAEGQTDEFRWSGFGNDLRVPPARAGASEPGAAHGRKDHRGKTGQNDKPKTEIPKSGKPKSERPRIEKPKTGKPKADKPKDEKVRDSPSTPPKNRPPSRDNNRNKQREDVNEKPKDEQKKVHRTTISTPIQLNPSDREAAKAYIDDLCARIKDIRTIMQDLHKQYTKIWDASRKTRGSDAAADKVYDEMKAAFENVKARNEAAITHLEDAWYRIWHSYEKEKKEAG
ncbi:DnaJ domain-containing protein [Xylariaceae sp. FL0255]|nr:DnaJ domain-containing protein [Xylariaceae sp. FL0255]